MVLVYATVTLTNKKNLMTTFLNYFCWIDFFASVSLSFFRKRGSLVGTGFIKLEQYLNCTNKTSPFSFTKVKSSNDTLISRLANSINA